ncbi:MAG TPA: glucoamylase family protein [Thermoanaerobaculia bacterium]|nr:glucoamylase family protein [Thermoanaerobaculia bacterium]
MKVLEPSLTGEELAQLECDTFKYFADEMNAENGLIPDNTRQGAPSSIAAVGFALTAYPIGVERGYMSRAEAIERSLITLRFFHDGPQGTGPDAVGYKGFYYHFLDMKTGRRVWSSEVSTIDTTFLLAGALAAAMYFDGQTKDESEIRRLAEALYARADWQWAQNGGLAVTHGWKPETGFIKYRWTGYSEALILYVLGLASPTFPLPEESYRAWTTTYRWKKLYGQEFLYAGPLFIHQFSHMWIDFRGIQDEYMSGKAIDYFENSRRAIYVQQAYAMRNPKGLSGYDRYSWGITASDGPGPAVRQIQGKTRRFYDYLARAVPYGPDDGTLAPWAVAASLPFAPEVVLPSLKRINEKYPEITSKYGLKCSYNPTFTSGSRKQKGWVSDGYYGLDQGPIVMMIENYKSGLVWRLMRQCPYIIKGLRRAGFQGGWLELGE